MNANKKSNRQIGEEPMQSVVVLRVTQKEKASWVRAAQPAPLAQWVRDCLNREAEKENK